MPHHPHASSHESQPHSSHHEPHDAHATDHTAEHEDEHGHDDHDHDDHGHAPIAHSIPKNTPQALTAAYQLLKQHTQAHGKAEQSTGAWLFYFAQQQPHRFNALYEGGIGHTDLRPLQQLKPEDVLAAASYLQQHLKQQQATDIPAPGFQPGIIGQAAQQLTQPLTPLREDAQADDLMRKGTLGLAQAVRSLGNHYDDLGRLLEHLFNRQKPTHLYRDSRKPKLGADDMELQTGLHIHPGEDWTEIAAVLAVAAGSAYLTDAMELPYAVEVAIKAGGAWPLYNSLVAGDLEHAFAHVQEGQNLQDAVKQSLITLMQVLGIFQRDGGHTLMAAHVMAALLKVIGNVQTDATQAALGALESMVQGLPTQAEKQHGDHTDATAVQDLRPGDRIHLTAGVQVPVDVKILRITDAQGQSLTTLDADTYWSHGQAKQRVGLSETLAQGTVPLDDGITIEAEVIASHAESTLMQRYEQQIHYTPTQQQSLAKRIGNGWVWGTLAVSLLTPINYLLQRVFKKEGIHLGDMIDQTASMATLSSPCNILVSTAVESFYNRNMIAEGVIPTQKGDISKAKPTDIYCLDFTGTCSLGQQFADVQFFDATGTALDAATSQTLFEQATLVGMKADAQHLMQKAMRRELLSTRTADELRQQLESMDSAEEVPSQGVRGQFHGQDIRVGRQSFLTDTEVPAEVKARFEALATDGQSLTYIRHGDHWGVARFHDTLRPEIIPTIQALHAAGKQVHILTGDSNRDYILKQTTALGIPPDRVHLSMTHTDKQIFIQQQQQAGKTVTMVGDGVNDAPALQQANSSYILADTAARASSSSADFIISSVAGILPHQKQAAKVTHLSGITLAFSVLYTGLTTVAQAMGITKLPILGAAVAHEGVSAVIAAGHKWLADRLTSTARHETRQLLGKTEQTLAHTATQEDHTCDHHCTHDHAH